MEMEWFWGLLKCALWALHAGTLKTKDLTLVQTAASTSSHVHGVASRCTMMYYVLCFMYYVLWCTMYYVLCTVYYVLSTMYYVLCTMYYVLCTMYYDGIRQSSVFRGSTRSHVHGMASGCTMMYYVLYNGYCVLCSVYCVLCSVYCVLCTVY